ncbi:MAG: PKD domain-containing protein [Vicinamibacterales bacterium]
MRQTFLAALATAGAAALLAGCTVSQSEPPPLTGPSELALAIRLNATPDVLVQNGIDQSRITIEGRDENGRTVDTPLRAEVLVDGQPVDFGTLSTKYPRTNQTITYTAPPRPAQSVDTGTVITIAVTPIGGDYRGERARQVDIRLVPPGVIVPPNGEPVPAFSVSPQPVTAFTPATFDASATTDDGVACGTRCSYAWNFGDGGTATGIVTSHEFRAAGTYTVRLTVTDDLGTPVAITQSVTVNASSAPVASFTFSPNAPAVSQDIFFTAEASRAAAGRRIIFYDWNFGSGRTGAGMTVSKRYDTPGTYIVTLTVTDDANQVGTISQPVTVGGQGTGIVPALSFSPTNPSTATTVVFDASASTGPSSIVEYRYSFGDTTSDVVGTSPVTSHRFNVAGTYVVRVTLRDAAGRTATTTVTVTVT